MAEKILNTRIALKIDSYTNWESSTIVLKKGEIALAEITADATYGQTEPVVMAKIGDGEHVFKDLEWNFYAKASDVLDACKDATKLTAFIENAVKNSSNIKDNTEFKNLVARVGTAEGKITALETITAGEGTIAERIANAIAAEAERAEAAYSKLGHDHEIADVNGLADAIADAKKAGTDANGALETYKGTNDAAVAEAKKAGTDAAAALEAYKTANDAAVAGKAAAEHDHEIGDVTGLQDALNAKAAGSDLEAVDGRVGTLETAVGDANSGLVKGVADNKAAIEVLNGTGAGSVSKAVADEASARDQAISSAISAEVTRADGKYATQETATGLQNQINTIMNNPDAEGAINSINEFTQYVKDHGTVAKGMQDAIEANAKAVADEETRAKGIEEGLAERLGKVELAVGNEGSVSGAIADALEEAKGYTDTEVKELADGAVKDNADAIAKEIKDRDDAVKAEAQARAKGDTDTLTAANSAADQKISAAIDGLKIGDYAKTADVEAAVGELEAADTALGGRIDGVAGRVTTAEGKITTLEGKMTTAEGNITGLQTEVAKKANDADLAAIAKTGNVNDLIQTEGDVLVFNCGTASTVI